MTLSPELIEFCLNQLLSDDDPAFVPSHWKKGEPVSLVFPSKILLTTKFLEQWAVRDVIASEQDFYVLSEIAEPPIVGFKLLTRESSGIEVLIHCWTGGHELVRLKIKVLQQRNAFICKGKILIDRMYA